MKNLQNKFFMVLQIYTIYFKFDDMMILFLEEFWNINEGIRYKNQ